MNRRHFLRTFLISLGAAPAIAKALASTALIDPPEVQPSRRVGPLCEMDYVNVAFAELPAEVKEITLTREDGSMDVFRVRPVKIEEPTHRGSSCMVTRFEWHDVCRLVDDREVEVESFQMCISMARSDINDGSMLSRIDEIVIEPPEITARWREVEI